LRNFGRPPDVSIAHTQLLPAGARTSRRITAEAGPRRQPRRAERRHHRIAGELFNCRPERRLHALP